MTTRRPTASAFATLGIVAIGTIVVARDIPGRPVNGTIWSANRAAHTIRGFDAATGDLVRTVPMAANSQPGDLASAKGKLYVAEEFGTPPAIAVVDPYSGAILHRITLQAGYRPHHVHASTDGTMVAVGLYGTDLVAVVDTEDDTLLGPWDSNPATTNGRVHAGVFAQNGRTLYLTSDATGEVIAMDPRSGTVFWRMSVPGAHELVLTHNGRTAFVSRRTFNKVALIDLATQSYQDVLTLGAPDTLQLSADEKLLTVGLRTSPAQLAVIDARSFTADIVTLSAPPAPGETATVGGHQWTSPSGRFTFASFEGGAHPGIAVIDHKAGNQVVQRLEYPGRPHGVEHVLPES